MDKFPYGVSILLGVGLLGTLFCIIYILQLANKEMQDETPESNPINHEPKH